MSSWHEPAGGCPIRPDSGLNLTEVSLTVATISSAYFGHTIEAFPDAAAPAF